MKLFNTKLKYYLLLVLPLLLVACDNNNPPAAVTLTDIAISPAAAPNGLPIDVTQAFTATGTYSNSSKQDITKTATWNSSTPGMATINSSGVATGVAVGATNITASLSGKTSNTVPLNVINPTLLSLVVTPATVPNKLVAGRTQSFKAEGVFDNNKSYDVTQWVDWKSSNLTAATIAQTGVATGEVIGTTSITAETTTPAVTSNTVALEVVLPNPDSVIIEPQTLDPLPVNRKQQFEALLKFDGDLLVNVTNNSTWTSSNTAIATVITSTVGAGQVTGVAPGDVTITATDNTTSLSKTVNVTVNDATITAVNVVPSNPNVLPAGYSQEFSATGTFTDGKTRKLSEPTAWTIDDTTIAMIEIPRAAVDVRGLKPGKANVSYIDLLADGKASGKVASSQLTVTNAILNSIAINPSAAFSIPAGGQTNLTAIGSYSDGVGRVITSEVIWESDTQSVAIVNPDGKLTALSVGAANVLAKAQNTATPPIVISSATVNVTVTGTTLQSLAIQPQLDPEVVGFTRQYSVTGTYTGGETTSYTQRVTWTSSDPAVLTVSNDVETKGKVTGVMAGIVTLTAKDPETGISDSLSVSVSQP